MARYRTLAEWEGLQGDNALTDAEYELIRASAAGEVCVLGDGIRPRKADPDRNIRCDLLSYLAAVAGISERAARKAIAKGTIKGCPAQTSTIDGARSRGGLMRVVEVASLPAEFQQRLREPDMATIAPTSLRIDKAGAAEHSWKLDVIRPIIAFPRGSTERRARLRQLVGMTLADWSGKPRTLTEATLGLWVRTYENSDGLHLCLAKKVRKDKGKSRVVIRKEWDRAVSFNAATCAAIRHELKQYMRGLIKCGTQRKNALQLTGDKLRDITAREGGDPDTMPPEAFVIPLDYYRDERRYQKVYRHKKDRKASHDAKPRIRRDPALLQPMDVVVMDVHHMNVLLRREDGTTATPKLIAFHDIATGRVFCELIMFEVKGGVRNADIITAFVNMCMDHAFGLPKILYVDNGSEYGWADDLQDALKLNIEIRGFDWTQDRSAIVRAIPYNAAAKQVEGWFRQMNQQYFRHIPGWIDDDRMNPKRERLGKPMPPYTGTWDEFTVQVREVVNLGYGHMPQSGALKGRSPLATFKAFVDAGWAATLMDPEEILTVFIREETRKVEKGCISVAGRFWFCDELIAHTGERVIVHIPKYHGFSHLRVTDGKGVLIGFAEADEPYEVLDQRGARESARRGSIYNRALAELDKSAPDIDVLGELNAFGRRRGTVTPNAPDAVVSVNGLGDKGLALPPAKVGKGPTRQETQEEDRLVDEARSALAGVYARKVS